MNTTAHKSELRPLPMRITRLQYERLVEARARDGMAVQEHVRRALDFYLAKVEREAERKQAAESPPDEPAPPPFNGDGGEIHRLSAPPGAHPRSGRPAPMRVRSR